MLIPHSRKAVAAAALSIFCLLGPGVNEPAQAADPRGPIPSASRTRVRFIHAIAGATNVHLRLDYDRVGANLRFGRGSKLKAHFQGDYAVDVVTAKGLSTLIPPTPLNFTAGQAYSVIATGSVSGDPAINVTMVPFNDTSVPGSVARTQFVHAVPDAPDVDIYVDGSLVDSNVTFRGFTVQNDFPRGWRNVEIKEAGTNHTLLGPASVQLKGETNHTLIFMGTADTQDGLPLTIQRYSAKPPKN